MYFNLVNYLYLFKLLMLHQNNPNAVWLKKNGVNFLQINFRSVQKFSLFQPWNVIYDIQHSWTLTSKVHNTIFWLI